MAEEPQYTSGPDSVSNKRKYEDPSPPSSGGTRRATGFSAPIASQSPDSGNATISYNSVPPPLDDFQLVKQKAQEIAARLYNTAEAKRSKVENGGGTGFDSYENSGQKPLISNVTPPSYGFQGSKKIDVPNGRVGVIIGKGGETIKYLQLQSGAKIQVTRDMDADPYSPTRMVELMGTPDQVAKAEQLIQDVLAEAEAGGSGTVSRRVSGQQPGAEQYVTKIPNNKVGLVIGKGGETIKNMQARSGARIQVIPLHLPPGDTSMERTLQIDGTSEQIEAAKELVEEVISENRARNSSMAGGYPQQGYQARPPTSWAPPGPAMQQPGYGYMQPGAYPTGQAPQYNTSQPQYPGYPPQPASGGYATGWDQTTGTPNQQTSQGGGGYDSAGYGYPQPPASGYNQQGQVYSQDGYGYGQPQTNPIQGYDQQQQGYGSAPGYGGVSNPTPDGNPPSYGGTQGDTSQVPPPVQPAATGQQGYTATTQQPSPNAASYPTQPGYGVPTSQPAYGTQPPSGYGSNYGPPQPPPAQYAQPDSSSYRAPPPAYGASAAQPGYAAPPYGAPPVTQPGYGQQQQPPYNSSYGGGYSQPPAYSADANAAPTSQAVQPSGVAKASPPS